MPLHPRGSHDRAAPLCIPPRERSCPFTPLRPSPARSLLPRGRKRENALAEMTRSAATYLSTYLPTLARTRLIYFFLRARARESITPTRSRVPVIATARERERERERERDSNPEISLWRALSRALTRARSSLHRQLFAPRLYYGGMRSILGQGLVSRETRVSFGTIW